MNIRQGPGLRPNQKAQGAATFLALTSNFLVLSSLAKISLFSTIYFGSLRVNLPPHHVVGNNAVVYHGKEVLQVLHEFWNFNIDNFILIHNDILETNTQHQIKAIYKYVYH